MMMMMVMWVCVARQVDERRAKEVREDVAFKLKEQVKEPEEAPRPPSAPFDEFSSIEVGGWVGG
jgi:hypothetical protein